MSESLGETLKKLRQEKELPMRKVAAHLDIDQAILSKIEHGNRSAKRDQVVQLAKYYKVDEKPLLIKWLAAKILSELENDELALDAIKLVETKLKKASSEPEKSSPGVLDYLKLNKTANTFNGQHLPTYLEFARYLLTTIAGKKLNEQAMNTHIGYIGESTQHEIYLFYKPNTEWLKNNALTLNMIKQLPDFKGKQRLVFASLKYVDDETLRTHHVEFGKIPY
jgi:transcriptional regulator with XRE-family HTH domain